ncbi:MAG: dihydrodipicolinate synthase family protein [Candidatus Latescibacterota bacterium]|nr:dihydrodipicolinate synthase family protein [Candidatus Latescibacterota bacterium]
MVLAINDLLTALSTVTSIPVVPFRGGKIDYDAHAKNVRYLIDNNHLNGEIRRVIGIAGTSLIHHVGRADQVELMRCTAEYMNGQGVLMAGIVPNPIDDAEDLLRQEAALPAPPDCYLVMPLTGVGNAEGIFQYYLKMAERLGAETGARLLYYLRNKAERETAVRLLNESEHFVGLKIGTDISDVEPIVAGVNDRSGLVIWGVGDRSTGPGQSGTRGHTSGINVVFAGASDAINNAQQNGDWETSMRVEEEIAELEEIRFRDGRMYNYSAVVEAMRLVGGDGIDGGEGGPFNPPVPMAVTKEIEKAIEPLHKYH